MQWFVERGFKEVPLTALPESRTKAYNYKRNSKCFAKQLSTSRDLDAQELFWGA
jgi:N-acetylglutamate synthase-like GNAT family acetyltransferase